MSTDSFTLRTTPSTRDTLADDSFSGPAPIGAMETSTKPLMTISIVRSPGLSTGEDTASPQNLDAPSDKGGEFEAPRLACCDHQRERLRTSAGG